MEAIRRCLISDKENEGQTVQIPEREFDVCINCWSGSDKFVLRIQKGGMVRILTSDKLWESLNTGLELNEKIKCLQEENRQAWAWGKGNIEALEATRNQRERRIMELENGIKNLRRGWCKRSDGLRISFKETDLFDLLNEGIK